MSARDRPYPGEDSVMGMKEENRTEYGSSRVALDGIAAKVKRVHVEGLVRTKEDVVSNSNKFDKNQGHLYNFPIQKVMGHIHI